MGQCCDYLRKNGYIPLSTSINSIRNNIAQSIKKQKPCYKLRFEYIYNNITSKDNTVPSSGSDS